MPQVKPLASALAVIVGSLALAAASTLHATHRDTLTPSREEARLTSAAELPQVQPTRVRISTFNVLGYGHTMNGERGFADGRTRQLMANQLIRANNLEIVGFQEMEPPQINAFKEEMGASYDLWPAYDYQGSAAVNVRANSIAWRKDEWTAIEKTYYDAPYFKGVNVPKPIVLLQNNLTGQQLYVTNTHNPANTFGNAQSLRNQSVDIQAKKFEELRALHPGVPIVFTGDMNDRKNFYCRFTAKSSLRAANGGVRTSSSCQLPTSPQIDWIMGTTDINWSGYQQLRTPYIKKTTDHPLIWADATIKPVAAQAAGIQRALVLDIEGLPSAALSPQNTPFLWSLRNSGASTLNARTNAETSGALPNLISMLTGRAAATGYGGHGVTWFKDNPAKKKRRTVKAGGYVRSVFDQVHDWGGSTSFMSSDPMGRLVLRTWRDAGAADGQGVDYGKSKVSVASIRKNDAMAIKVVKDQLRINPRALSVVQLSSLARNGKKSGYLSPAYLKALRGLDRRLSTVFTALAGNSRTAASTLLVITADSGGHGQKATGSTAQNYTVPMFVWGSGVPGGTDLYALNPGYADPGPGQVSYAGAQPIRPSAVANLVTGVLGLPAVPGSTAGVAQDFNVFKQP
ncbi:hypothetical protein [Nocardioides sp.]|uniref:hypothetical protein n=1 Tax=Nocardioides sp. TaxID=35761 RepID=UPI0039E2F56E